MRLIAQVLVGEVADDAYGLTVVDRLDGNGRPPVRCGMPFDRHDLQRVTQPFKRDVGAFDSNDKRMRKLHDVFNARAEPPLVYSLDAQLVDVPPLAGLLQAGQSNAVPVASPLREPG